MPGQAQEPARQPQGASYSLRLYVTGATSGSSRAIACIKAFCDRFLKGRYSLEVIDVYQQPAIADARRIVATPTLDKVSPLPFRIIVFNLADQGRLS
jgi:circadian clock protein KaiB